MSQDHVTSSPSPEPPPAQSPIAADAQVSCIRCGYSLFGLDPRRPCPECGLLVGLSHLDSRELRHNHPRWLRRLTIGAILAAVGMLTLPAIGAFLNDLGAWLRARRWGGRAVNNAVMPALSGTDPELVVLISAITLPPMLLLVGCWLLASRPARQSERSGSRGMRGVLPTVGALPLLSVAALILLSADRLPGDVGDGWIVGACVAAMAPLPAFLFAYLRDLARRAPAPLLAADSPIVGVALGLSILISVAAIPIMANLWAGTSALAVAAGLIVAVCLAVCGAAWLWSVYLLLRYALAFSKTAQQARALIRQFGASRPGAPAAYDPPP